VLFHFSTAVWGAWHTAAFLDVNLPSLLASDNLPAFAARHQVLHRIFTSADDAARISASPAFRRAKDIIRFELVESIGTHPANPIAMHHVLWRRSIEDARAAGAMIAFIPPDVAWANGSFAHLAHLASEGKRAIYTTYLRVMQETCVPDLLRLHANPATSAIDASSRELVDLALRHIHPLAITCMRDSGNFPIHPELILWPVPGEGLLMRVLVREMFAYDPRLIDLNERALAAHPIDSDLVHYVTDSDDLFAVSLTPALQDIEWYVNPQRLDPLKVASWWLAYDSPNNEVIAGKHFFIHPRARSAAAWSSVAHRSDALMQRIGGIREVLRTLGAMTDPDIEQARRVLVMALVETKIASVVRGRGPMTLLLPVNGAILRWLLSGGDAVLRPGRRRELVDLVLNYAIVGRLAFNPGQDMTLTTARGATRALTWRGKVPLVDGVAVRLPGFELGRHRAHVMEQVLPAANAGHLQ
jgi:hypothetical protein